MHRYKTYNSPMPTTAGQSKVTTGTAIKTLLQIATPSTREIQIVSWGISFDGSAAATPGTVELIQTDVAATVTAHVASGVVPLDAGWPASLVTLGTSGDGLHRQRRGHHDGIAGLRRATDRADQPVHLPISLRRTPDGRGE